MAKLTYTAITSLDGYIEDEKGRFDWAVPDAEVHAFANDLERPIGTHLYGRRMYETMAVWQTVSEGPDVPPVEADYAEVWRTAAKVVYSRSLEAVSTPRTRLEREFEPEAIRRLKDAAPTTSRSAGLSWPPTRSAPDWSTRSTCSCARSSWAAASRDCPATSGSTSSSSTNVTSATAWSSCATARDERPARAPHQRLVRHAGRGRLRLTCAASARLAEGRHAGRGWRAGPVRRRRSHPPRR
jgi:dihydrofolate reductase